MNNLEIYEIKDIQNIILDYKLSLDNPYIYNLEKHLKNKKIKKICDVNIFNSFDIKHIKSELKLEDIQRVTFTNIDNKLHIIIFFTNDYFKSYRIEFV